MNLQNLFSAPFAILEKNNQVEIHTGEFLELKTIEQIGQIADQSNRPIVFNLPYNQIKERGFQAKGDLPILAIHSDQVINYSLQEFLTYLPTEVPQLKADLTSDIADLPYQEIIKQVIANEIEGGNASQVTISRTFSGDLESYTPTTILSIFHRLLESPNHYLAFLFVRPVANSFQVILGASPERLLEVTNTECLMTPIAGTFRKLQAKDLIPELKAFLNDPKEINELYQVLDEELKIMGRICKKGGQVIGPKLKELSSVIHTEYELVGLRAEKPLIALKSTLHAPTVVGSPMESAARIISQYETTPRRYYAGEIGIYRPAINGQLDTLDSGILIRSAEISPNGNIAIRAGGGIVRNSNPESEALESRAKAAGFIRTVFDTIPPKIVLTSELRGELEPLLASRNEQLSQFMLNPQNPEKDHTLLGCKILIINNEDDFAFTIGHYASHFGAKVTVVDTLAEFDLLDYQIIVLGPGPGDPSDFKNPRMIKLQQIVEAAKVYSLPLLGVCLGHQALAISQGLKVPRQNKSTQGMQKNILLAHGTEPLAFYNSFSPLLDDVQCKKMGITYQLDENQRIVEMFGDRFVGCQFHPESVMSKNGANILKNYFIRLKNYA